MLKVLGPVEVHGTVPTGGKVESMFLSGGRLVILSFYLRFGFPSQASQAHPKNNRWVGCPGFPSLHQIFPNTVRTDDGWPQDP